MSKKLLTQLPLVVAALLLLAAAPVQADPPQEAEGLWQYLPTVVSERPAGCNLFVSSTEEAVWSGTFNGDSTEVGEVVFHCNGRVGFNAIVTFDEVTVDGKSGSLELSVNGILRDPADPDWKGHWVILSGTGDLANLHGSGTFSGPGYNPAEPLVPGQIYYDGHIKFAPSH